MTTKPKTRRSKNTPMPQTDAREVAALNEAASALVERAMTGDLLAMKEVADAVEEAEIFDTVQEAATAKRSAATLYATPPPHKSLTELAIIKRRAAYVERAREFYPSLALAATYEGQADDILKLTHPP